MSIYPLAGRGWNDPDLDPDFTPPEEPLHEAMDVDSLIIMFRAVNDEYLIDFVDNAVINHVNATVYRVATMELALRFGRFLATKKSA